MLKPFILLVPRERIELSQGQAPRDFKSLASTNSATQAIVTLDILCHSYNLLLISFST